MDWFESLTGFRESTYRETQARLESDGHALRSRVNGASYGIGTLELVSLEALRDRTRRPTQVQPRSGRLSVGIVEGDVRALHRSPENAGALFQVASQFNLLEMVGPRVTPEHGVAIYADDRTQGPACAIAAGAATIYRNYFAPVGDQVGQTHDRQLDGLAPLGDALAAGTGLPVDALWKMQNGYALCSREGLDAIARHLSTLDHAGMDALRGRLCIGLHHDVEVTDMPLAAGATGARPVVSQAFCSALPVAYGGVPQPHWKAFATLVLEAAYEATLCAAIARAQSGASNRLLLTALGGGVFGNDEAWIHHAILRALRMFEHHALDVKLVSFAEPATWMKETVAAFD
ncbi:MAG: hypothetical protein ACK515_08485 [bacterium]|nr:hypothetical protein [Betaproteobacteria bacterium]